MKTVIEECGQILPEVFGATITMAALTGAIHAIRLLADFIIELYI